MSESRAKHWCFTINNPDIDSDKFWEGILDTIEYIVVQEEVGANGTLHYQGYVIFKHRKRLSQLKRLNARAHWEVSRGTPTQASEYCKKDDTYTGGLRFEHGCLPKREASKKASERLEAAAEELDTIKRVGYKRPSEIPSMTLLQCGFVPAYKSLCADVLGPYRPQLKIITMVGPPGSGKSYAIQKYFPDAGRCIVGNNGVWFQRPTADCMVFEEFNGQIQLQRMLQLLDVYPLALEVKGAMAPAMYTWCIITSNTPPQEWYTIDQQQVKRNDAIKALWDRIGYSGNILGEQFFPTRRTGHYLEAPSLLSITDMQQWFDTEMARIVGREPITDSDSDRDTVEDHRLIYGDGPDQGR